MRVLRFLFISKGELLLTAMTTIFMADGRCYFGLRFVSAPIR